MSKSSIAYIALGIALITIMTLLGLSAFLRTSEIRVEGSKVYSIEEIIKSSGLIQGDNLMFINPDNVASKIRSELPFIEAVTISRLVPDTVLIEVVESVAIARVTSAGWYYIIDSAGRVLARSYNLDEADAIEELGIVYESLIEVRGLEIEESNLGSVLKPIFGAETKLTYTQDILTALERQGIEEDISYIDVSNIVNVSFGYLGWYRVILGGSTSLRPSNIRHNIERLVEAIPRIQASFPNTSGAIDVSDETIPPRFTPS